MVFHAFHSMQHALPAAVRSFQKLVAFAVRWFLTSLMTWQCATLVAAGCADSSLDLVFVAPMPWQTAPVELKRCQRSRLTANLALQVEELTVCHAWQAGWD